MPSLESYNKVFKDKKSNIPLYYNQNCEVQKVACNLLLELVGKKNIQGRSILDIGAGTGMIADQIINKFQVTPSVTQIDKNPQMLEYAKKYGKIKTCTLPKGLQSVLKEGNYNLALSSMAMQWLSVDDLNFCCSLLKNNGVKLFFSIPTNGTLRDFYKYLDELLHKNGKKRTFQLHESSKIERETSAKLIKQEEFNTNYGSSLNLLKYFNKSGLKLQDASLDVNDIKFLLKNISQKQKWVISIFSL